MYFEFLQELLFVWEAESNTRYSVSSVGLKKLSCALSLPLRMKYSLCLIHKRFSYLFPRKLMKVLSLSFTSNREDMLDLDSSVTRIAIVLINLIERIFTLFVWFVRSMWFIYQRDCDSHLSESVCNDLVLCSPSSKTKAEQKRQFSRSERVGFRRRRVIQDGLGFWIPFQWNLDSTSKSFSHSGMRISLLGASSGRAQGDGNRSFRHKLKQWNWTKFLFTLSVVCKWTRKTFWVNIFVL